MTNIEIIAWIGVYIILFFMLIFSELQRLKSNKQREEIWKKINEESLQEINNLTNKNQ